MTNQFTLEPDTNYEVIGTGSVFSFEQNALRFKLTDSNDLFLNIDFKNTKNDTMKHDVEINLKNDTLNISLINFNNTLGTGTKKPMYIGETDKGKGIYMHFRVYAGSTKDADKLVFYTLYLGQSQKGNSNAKK